LIGDPKKRNENDAKALAEKIAKKKASGEGGGVAAPSSGKRK
jgi:hypothetical protein